MPKVIMHDRNTFKGNYVTSTMSSSACKARAVATFQAKNQYALLHFAVSNGGAVGIQDRSPLTVYTSTIIQTYCGAMRHQFVDV